MLRLKLATRLCQRPEKLMVVVFLDPQADKNNKAKEFKDINKIKFSHMFSINL